MRSVSRWAPFATALLLDVLVEMCCSARRRAASVRVTPVIFNGFHEDENPARIAISRVGCISNLIASAAEEAETPEARQGRGEGRVRTAEKAGAMLQQLLQKGFI